MVQWVSEYAYLSSEIDDGDVVRRETVGESERVGGSEEGREEGSGGVNSRYHESSINHYVNGVIS